MMKRCAAVATVLHALSSLQQHKSKRKSRRPLDAAGLPRCYEPFFERVVGLQTKKGERKREGM